MTVIGIKISTTSRSEGSTGVLPPSGTWILADGTWNDGGTWDDSQTWID